MKLKIFLALFAGICGLNVFSATNDNDSAPHDKNEIGIANSPVYFIKEDLFAYGLHLHYIRNISKTKFGIGLGYERIFDEHGHNTLGVVAAYKPMEALSVNFSPGLTFEDADPKMNLALHFETSYEFEIKNIHLGPVLEFAYEPEDLHISLGIHLAYSF